MELSECVPVADYLSFEEVHGGEFVPYDRALDTNFADIENVVLWTYPGSGKIAWAKADARWFRENVMPAEAFSQCWEDGEGRLWGFVNYCYGWRNTWVCLSDPDNTDLAADPEVLPEKTVYYPAADPVPAPSSGVSGLAAVLVVLVVAGTAVLIPVVCRGGRRPGE